MLKKHRLLFWMKPLPLLTPDNESRVQAAFSKLSEGKTSDYIAHRLSTVTNVDTDFCHPGWTGCRVRNIRESLAKDGIFSRMWKKYQELPCNGR